MDLATGPTGIIWDVTYACPLRCAHCYSESGRRAARQLSHADMLRVADALVSMRPRQITLSGGEPLLVPGILEVAERISLAGVPVALYTSGWSLKESAIEDIMRLFIQVSVSMDGATAEVHDRIRGRRGSFDRAMRALTLFDEAAGRRVPGDAAPFSFGIDCVITRGNFHQLEDFCTRIAPKFTALRYVSFGAVVPTGLASRSGFADHELLTDAQMTLMGDPAMTERLRRAAPASVRVMVNDNLELQMHPDADYPDFRPLQVEPDGEVRAMPIYEGTVGSLLTESPAVLWQRATARWKDPVVVENLKPVHTMKEWAVATRRIDYHFGSAEVRARIDRRPEYGAPSLPSRKTR